ncbi:hypothetical protein ACOSQ2_018908 [Xanthoceras sorbifolium]
MSTATRDCDESLAVKNDIFGSEHRDQSPQPGIALTSSSEYGRMLFGRLDIAGEGKGGLYGGFLLPTNFGREHGSLSEEIGDVGFLPTQKGPFARHMFLIFLQSQVQPPADSDGEDLEEEPLIRHSSLKGKDKATLEDEKLSDSEVVGDDEIVVVPSGEKGIRTFARSVGGRKGVSDPSPSEP